MSVEVGGPQRPVHVSCSVDARRLESGDFEVLLERSDRRDGDKLKRELFILPDGPETRTLLHHLERLAA